MRGVPNLARSGARTYVSLQAKYGCGRRVEAWGVLVSCMEAPLRIRHVAPQLPSNAHNSATATLSGSKNMFSVVLFAVAAPRSAGAPCQAHALSTREVCRIWLAAAQRHASKAAPRQETSENNAPSTFGGLTGTRGARSAPGVAVAQACALRGWCCSSLRTSCSTPACAVTERALQARDLCGSGGAESERGCRALADYGTGNCSQRLRWGALTAFTRRAAERASGAVTKTHAVYARAAGMRT